MFLRNCWYIACEDGELQHKPLARTILKENIVLYRDAEGQPAALKNRCSHRAVELSEGWLYQGNLQCRYHGLCFNRKGECVEVPGQDSIPPQSAVRSYPTHEQYGYIWVWMGDPDKADINLLPHEIMQEIEDEDSVTIRGQNHIRCYYELLNDNLLDLGHIEFVHKATFGGASFSKGGYKTWEEDDRIMVTRDLVDLPPSTGFKILTDIEENIDSIYHSTWKAPCCIKLQLGGVIHGKPMDEGYYRYTAHMITPETETTSRYFWSLSRHFKQDDQRIDREQTEMVVAAFLEDKEILEAQQRGLAEEDSHDIQGMRLAWLNADKGAGMARRILRRKLREDEATL